MSESTTTIIIEAELDAAPLTSDETERLAQHEMAIQTGIDTFLSVGQALLAISQDRLYRATHRRFEEYVADRWPQLGTVRQVYRLMDAAEVAQNVTNWSEELPPPANEAQARPLAQLPPEEQGPVYAEAVATAPQGKVTAAHIQQTVNKKLGKPAASSSASTSKPASSAASAAKAATPPAPAPAAPPPPPPVTLTPLQSTAVPPPLAAAPAAPDLAARKALVAKYQLLEATLAIVREELEQTTSEDSPAIAISAAAIGTAARLFATNSSLNSAAQMLSFSATVVDDVVAEAA